MYISLFTPPVENNTEISTVSAHLIEHILGMSFGDSIDSYIKFINASNAETYSSYTRYYFPDDIPTQQAVQQLLLGITKKHYKKEKNALQTELKQTKYEYINGLAYRVSQKLYGKKYTGDYSKISPFSDIEQYYNTWYNKANMIICDDSYTIISTGRGLKMRKSIGADTIKKIVITQNQNTIINMCYSHTSSAHHRKAFFMYQLIDAYIRYNERYVLGKYYYNAPEYFKTWKHWVISYNKHQLEGLDENFFTSFKKHYSTTLSTRIDTYRKIIDRLHALTPLTDKQHTKLIETIQFSDYLHSIKKST